MGSKNANLPSFIPTFSVDQQSGGLEANPAGSVAIAKMERLLQARDNARATFVSERTLAANRQRNLDKYLGNSPKGDIAPKKSGGYMQLPTIASPQPVHLFDSKVLHQTTENNRERQVKEFSGSYMANRAKFIYEEIDDALRTSDARKVEVLSNRKGQALKGLFKSTIGKGSESIFSKNEKKYIFDPLEEAISYLNRVFVEDEIPVQVRWREVWKAEGDCRKELFMIFPVAAHQTEKPMSTWWGMNEAL